MHARLGVDEKVFTSFEGGLLLRQETKTLVREGEHHIVGIHGVAIVENDAFAQLQLDSQRINLRPFGGQHRLLRQVRVLALVVDQRLEYRIEHARTNIGLFAHNVERAGGDDVLHGDSDYRAILRVKRCGEKAARRRGHREYPRCLG